MITELHPIEPRLCHLIVTNTANERAREWHTYSPYTHTKRAEQHQFALNITTICAWQTTALCVRLSSISLINLERQRWCHTNLHIHLIYISLFMGLFAWQSVEAVLLFQWYSTASGWHIAINGRILGAVAVHKIIYAEFDGRNQIQTDDAIIKFRVEYIFSMAVPV